MKSKTDRRFRDLLAALPKHVRRQATIAYHQFAANPSHRGLRFKQIFSAPPIYSARIGISHRAVGSLDGDTITWFWIGSHADYDKLLDQL